MACQHSPLIKCPECLTIALEFNQEPQTWTAAPAQQIHATELENEQKLTDLLANTLNIIQTSVSGAANQGLVEYSLNVYRARRKGNGDER